MAAIGLPPPVILVLTYVGRFGGIIERERRCMYLKDVYVLSSHLTVFFDCKIYVFTHKCFLDSQNCVIFLIAS
jgi:hypothetical protein